MFRKNVEIDLGKMRMEYSLQNTNIPNISLFVSRINTLLCAILKNL